jgi:hypothetical protein
MVSDLMEACHRPPCTRGPELPGEIPLTRDLTDCVLAFVRDRVSLVVGWVAWAGSDPPPDPTIHPRIALDADAQRCPAASAIHRLTMSDRAHRTPRNAGFTHLRGGGGRFEACSAH